MNNNDNKNDDFEITAIFTMQVVEIVHCKSTNIVMEIFCVVWYSITNQKNEAPNGAENELQVVRKLCAVELDVLC